ncbi:MAG: ABC transporter permease [Myxococcaceae bacterium]|nr:ABC transporter permease [Myxococcaceae bacterium]
MTLALTLPLRVLGAASLSAARATGALALVLGRTLWHLPRLDLKETGRALVLFGYRSLPLTLGIAVLTGMTVVFQAGVYAEKFGARLYAGWAGAYAVLWEFGPILLGQLMAARIGARNAAELALLKVNGQIEGLRGISLDPFGLLVAPRVVASALAVSCLASITFLIAIVVEAVAAYFTLDLPPRVFLEAVSHMIRPTDFLAGLIKATAFGVAISIVSTACGLSASGGARGVGRAAAQAVVASAAAIFSLDFVLTAPLARWLS